MIFSTNDPLGRSVILKQGTWQYKILIGHPEVKEYLWEIKSLIENPYYIVKDLIEIEKGVKEPHATREEYFDFIPNKSTGFVVLKTVVDHSTNPSEIVTALISSKTRGLTTEGGIIYVRSQETNGKKKAE